MMAYPACPAAEKIRSRRLVQIALPLLKAVAQGKTFVAKWGAEFAVKCEVKKGCSNIPVALHFSHYWQYRQADRHHWQNPKSDIHIWHQVFWRCRDIFCQVPAAAVEIPEWRKLSPIM